jgi:hypothetical protein
MLYGQKLKLGDAHVTPRNIQEVQASKLGDAPRHYICIASYAMCFSWSVFTFAFSFILFCLLQ